jgi:plastocyanin
MAKGAIIGIIIVLVLIVGGFFLFSGDEPTAPTTTQPPTQQNQQTAPSSGSPQTHKVTIQNFKFSPPSLNINTGDTVVWTNKDGAPHTATSDDTGFDSDRLDEDDTFSFTFTQAGTNPYHCGFHPSMTATVTVQ